MALDYFREIGSLVIEQKGVQDVVSNADRETELLVRRRISERFPDDGVVGEEFDDIAGRSGFTWVIDPIDGTANFVRGIPAWTVVLACLDEAGTKVGIVHEPCNDEMFWAAAGAGAFLNDIAINVADASSLADGSLGVGMNNRTPRGLVVRFIDELLQRNGIFYRNASGALMLAYVASGRLIGYAEPHMNAWDCLAGQLLIAEAGGRTEAQDMQKMLSDGGRVLASSPGVFDELIETAGSAGW